MIVETAPIVPGEEDGPTVPIRPLHKSIHQTRDIRLTITNQSRGMLAGLPIRDNPGDGGQCPVLCTNVEI